MSSALSSDNPVSLAPPARGTCELLLLEAGGRLLAVPSEDVDGTMKWKRPAPLPRAPAAILGIVSSRGRMWTVLDPVELFGDPTRPTESAPAERCIVRLRGDEKLALAVDHAGDIVSVATDQITAAPGESNPRFLRGIYRRDGRAIEVLDASELFDASMAGTDRRRRRTDPSGT